LDGEDYMIELGCPYVQARAALRVIANQLHHSLIGFGDLDIERLQKLSGLSAVAAQHAKARDFSELFITPKAVPTDQLVSVVEDMGFQVVVGDRFCQLIGPTAGTDRAVRQLIDLYQAVLPPTTRLTTVGLGHCPNDLPLLEMVDWPIIVPGPEGPHPQLAERGWPVASAPGPAGWAAAVQGLCEQLGIVV
jgi:mannosyl-3-phosphoglycerate phosphatase